MAMTSNFWLMASSLNWIKWAVFRKERILRWIILIFEVTVFWSVVAAPGDFKHVDFKVAGFLTWIFNKFDRFTPFLVETTGSRLVEGLLALIEWFLRWFPPCCPRVGFNILQYRTTYPRVDQRDVDTPKESSWNVGLRAKCSLSNAKYCLSSC